MSNGQPEIPEQERGFIFEKEFFPLIWSEKGKDLILLDRLTQRPPDQVLDELQAGVEVRGPSALALIAMSLRAARPGWPLEKIIDVVGEIDPDADLEWIGVADPDDAEDEARPPDEGEGSQEPSPKSSEQPAIPSETRSEIPA